jgi:hypothetical protein
LVSPHLTCLPELPKNEVIDRLSQCQKWREGFSKDLRVQMVVSQRKHFYIYEVVQLVSKQLVVPVFFFQENGRIIAKCLPAEVQVDEENPNQLDILIPAEPPFESNDLYRTDVTDFWRTSTEIELEDGTPLVDRCEPYIYREFIYGHVIQNIGIDSHFCYRRNIGLLPAIAIKEPLARTC